MPQTSSTSTPPDLDPKEVARRLAQFFELHEVGRELALAGLKYDHPNASPQELRRLLGERLALFRHGKWEKP